MIAIVKVQLPLFTNRADVVALVYDRERKHMVEQPIDAKTRGAMRGDRKAFFQATWGVEGRWVIGKRLPEHFW